MSGPRLAVAHMLERQPAARTVEQTDPSERTRSRPSGHRNTSEGGHNVSRARVRAEEGTGDGGRATRNKVLQKLGPSYGGR